MADKKISQLSGATTPLAGTEVLPIVQSSSTVKVSIDNITKGRTVNATTFDTDVAAAGVTLTGTTLSADGTDTNIDINITPKGTGEVNLTKVDIDAGTIDGTAIGGSSASTAVFTQLDVDNIRIDGNTISSTNTDGNISLTPNGSGGVITANLTTGNTVVLGSGSGFSALNIQSSAAGGADVSWRTGTSNRWILSKTGAETGSDAGSDLFLYRYTDAGGFLGTVMSFTRSNGNVAVNGALSKGSGSFRIDHPLPEKAATHQLVHSFIEGPQIDLIYRGKAKLINGKAEINIDQHFGMTPGTFVALCRDTQCFTSNEEGWHRVRGRVVGATLTIECEDAACSDTVSWLVIGERHDKHVMDTDWTDENGKVILEPLKPAVNRK